MVCDHPGAGFEVFLWNCRGMSKGATSPPARGAPWWRAQRPSRGRLSLAGPDRFLHLVLGLLDARRGLVLGQASRLELQDLVAKKGRPLEVPRLGRFAHLLLQRHDEAVEG